MAVPATTTKTRHNIMATSVTTPICGVPQIPQYTPEVGAIHQRQCKARYMVLGWPERLIVSARWGNMEEMETATAEG